MHIIGIIAEYNPFHNGHYYQICKIREAYPDAKLICAMSGSFTQRGTIAILDKWKRAQLAIQGGIDLVLELPFVFAVRSAQDFAQGGIRLLDRLGIVQYLAFGTECDDLCSLRQTAALLDSAEIRQRLKTGLKSGCSYAAALSQALENTSKLSADQLKGPNNILAIEYLRALQKINASITPMPLLRKAAGYHDINIQGSLASATAIRRELLKNQPDQNLLTGALPQASFSLLQKSRQNNQLPDHTLLLRPLLASLYQYTLPELRKIYGINEGLEYKLLNAAKKSSSLTELLLHTKSKRYPQSRIQRILLYLLLSLSQERILTFDAAGPLYARVLAFGSDGRRLLHTIKQQSSLPIITKTSQFLTTAERCRGPEALSPLQQMLAYDTLSTDFAGLCLPHPLPSQRDFTTSPYFIS